MTRWLSGQEQGHDIQRFTVSRSSRQTASDISRNKMAGKAERDLEKGQDKGIERGKLERKRVTVWAM